MTLLGKVMVIFIAIMPSCILVGPSPYDGTFTTQEGERLYIVEIIHSGE